MNIKECSMKPKGVSFTGHSSRLDNQGKIEHSFYYVYDTNKYDCEVELYNIDINNSKIKILQKNNPQIIKLPSDEKVLKELKIPARNVKIPNKIFTNNLFGFAYRFKLTEKDNPENFHYAFDNGEVLGIEDEKNTDNKFNIILSNRAVINKNGPMQLIMPDEYYPGIVKGADGKPYYDNNLREKALNASRTHANKLGGGFYGIINRLPEIKKEGIVRIVGTPYTKDTVSSHKYWTENAYQVSPDMGNLSDFKEMQRKLFSYGINWIADAALVNEGLNGIHLDSALRRGREAFEMNMFSTSENKEQKILGVLPSPDNNDETIKHTKMKIINAYFVIKNSKIQKNNDYDPNKPTYIQFYDDRLADEAQINSDSPADLKTYAKKNPGRNGENIYDITKHDDAVYPFAFEVDPEQLKKNVKTAMLKKEKIKDSKRIPYEAVNTLTDFSNFKIAPKNKAGRLELWDGNVDIAKLKFYVTDRDLVNKTAEQKELLQRGTLAVRDYALNSGRYWTKLTADTQLEFIASNLSGSGKSAAGYAEKIKQLVKEGVFPENTLDIFTKTDENNKIISRNSNEIIENVLNGSYYLKKLDDKEYTASEFIFKNAVNTPLETVPAGNNLMSILSSPYLTQRAASESGLELDKYELQKQENPAKDKYFGESLGRMNNLYRNTITPAIKNILSGVSGIADENGNISDYGRYIVSAAAPELTSYLITKALAPNEKIKFDENGDVDFSEVNPENVTIQSLGLTYNSGRTQKEEALYVIDKIEKGIKNISSSEINMLKQKMADKFKNKTLSDYKTAEMILDRTESGLGWRIDAAKDIASIDQVRANKEPVKDAWDNVIDFWKKFNQTILKENRRAYTTAELTDLDALFPYDNMRKYHADADAERKFLKETGITSTADYNFFYSMPPAVFSRFSPENGEMYSGWSGWMADEVKNSEIKDKLVKGWEKEQTITIDNEIFLDPEDDEKVKMHKDGTRYIRRPNNPGFLYQSTDDGVKNAYNFAGNHDKPRILHTLGLDMNLFHGGLKSPEHKQRAAAVVRQKNPDFSKIDSKAAAMGERINQAIDDKIKDDKLNIQLKEAAAALVMGSYKGRSFASEAFGTRPFETAVKSVLEQAAYMNGNKPVPNRETIEAQLLQSMLEPALDRLKSIYKMLVVLPGSPADFAGDKLGLTGYESKAKNYHQQNRNVIRWEWLTDPRYSFIKDFYDEMNEISNLRSDKKLSALNNGDTAAVPVMAKRQYFDNNGNVRHEEIRPASRLQAILRYNNEGSVVISLFDNTGADAPVNKTLDRVSDPKPFNDGSIEVYNSIVLNPDEAGIKEGVNFGLKPGMKFKNYKTGDEFIIKKINAEQLKEMNKCITEGKAQEEGAGKAEENKNTKEYYVLEPVIKINSRGAVKKPFKFTADERNTMILYNINSAA